MLSDPRASAGSAVNSAACRRKEARRRALLLRPISEYDPARPPNRIIKDLETVLNSQRPSVRRAFSWWLTFGSLLCLAACAIDRTSDEITARGRELLNKGDTKAAWIEARSALAKDPNNDNARMLMGEVHLSVGAAANAEKEFLKALELGRPRHYVELPMIVSLLLQEKHSDLDEWLKTALEGGKWTPDEEAQLWAYQAQSYYSRDRIDDTKAAINRSLAAVPGNRQGVLIEAMVMAKESDIKGALDRMTGLLATNADFAAGWFFRGQLEKAIGKIDEAIHSFGEAANNRLNNQGDLFQRGILLALTKRFEEAQKDADALTRKAGPAQAGLIRGLIALGQGRAEEARTELLNFIKVAPNFAPARLMLAQAHFALGETEQAVVSLDAVIQAEPRALYPRKLAASIASTNGNYRRVMQLLLPLHKERQADTDTLEMLGNAALGMGAVQQALGYYQEAEQLNPNSDRYATSRGLALMATGDFERGFTTLDETAAKATQSPETEARVITALLRANQIARAEKRADALFAAHPKSTLAHLLRGVTLRAKGENDQAYALMEEGLKLQPADPSLNHNLADMDIAAKRFDPARARYEAVLKVLPDHERSVLKLVELDSLLGNMDAAIERLDAYLKKVPDSIQAKLMLAQHLLGTERFVEAERMLEATRASNKDSITLRSLLAEALTAQGNYRAAATVLEEATVMAPGMVDLQYRLGQAYSLSGDPSKAMLALEKGLQLAPNHLPSLVARFRALVLTGNREAAEQALAGLRQQFPDDPEVEAQAGWFAMQSASPEDAAATLSAAFGKAKSARLAQQLASAQAQAGDSDAAIATLKSWLEQTPTDSASRTQLAMLFAANKDMDAAIAELKLVLEQSPDDPNHMNNLAWMLSAKDPDTALSLAEKAYAKRPNDAAIIDTLARVHFVKGNVSEAERLIKQSLERDPASTALRMNLAELQATHDRSAALATVNALLKDQPDHERARKLLQNLQQE